MVCVLKELKSFIFHSCLHGPTNEIFLVVALLQLVSLNVVMLKEIEQEVKHGALEK